MMFHSRRSRVTLGVAALFGLFNVPDALHAWGATGHMIVAQVAYDRLNDDARREADRLIAVLGEIEPRFPDFVSAATWMDAIKDDLNAFDDWHYIDVPINPLAYPAPTVPSQNVVWAIAQARDTLSHPGSDFEKALMLRFLIHFVGDIHQPLHCAARFNADFPAGDRGGNDFLLKKSPSRAAFPCDGLENTVGDADELHALWDNTAHLFAFVDPGKEIWKKCIPRFARAVEKEVPKISVPRWTETDPNLWAEESNELARSVCYVGIEQDAEPSPEYISEAQRVIYQRLALGGYRLAALLNETLGDKSTVGRRTHAEPVE